MSTFIDLLRIHHSEFERQFGNQLSHDSRRAIYAMLSCKTGKQACSQWFCKHCNHDDRLPLSCGHRHCPQCQQRTTSDWLERQQSKLLPVYYFMVTVTLPYEFRPLARRQPKALYQSMFSVSASILKDFAKRKHGGEIGLPPSYILTADNVIYTLICTLLSSVAVTIKRETNGIKVRVTTCLTPLHSLKSGEPE